MEKIGLDMRLKILLELPDYSIIFVCENCGDNSYKKEHILWAEKIRKFNKTNYLGNGNFMDFKTCK